MTTERRRGSFASDSLQGPATNELDAMKRSFEERIQQLLSDNNDGADLLSMSMRAATLGAGKRMRPLLLMVIARDLGCASPALIDVACAVELVHASSLVLDDMPCMDDARLRRGAPAIHVTFGQDVAILASIALLSRAFRILSRAEALAPLVRTSLVGALADQRALTARRADVCQAVSKAVPGGGQPGMCQQYSSSHCRATTAPGQQVCDILNRKGQS